MYNTDYIYTQIKIMIYTILLIISTLFIYEYVRSNCENLPDDINLLYITFGIMDEELITSVCGRHDFSSCSENIESYINEYTYQKLAIVVINNNSSTISPYQQNINKVNIMCLFVTIVYLAIFINSRDNINICFYYHLIIALYLLLYFYSANYGSGFKNGARIYGSDYKFNKTTDYVQCRDNIDCFNSINQISTTGVDWIIVDNIKYDITTSIDFLLIIILGNFILHTCFVYVYFIS